MKKIVLTLIAGLLIAAPIYAQEDTESTEATGETQATESTTEEEPADKYLMFQNKHALALNFGLPGFGGEYAYNINRNLNLRAGFLTFALNDFNTDLDISGQSVNVNANLSSQVFDLFLEYQPSSNSAFKLVAGMGYINNVGVNTLILLNDDIAFGDLTIANEEIGDIDINITWTSLAPYVGFGWGRAVPKKRVGFGIEMGTYYAGGPNVDIVATGMLVNTSDEAAEMEENLASYAWMPRIMARLAVKL